MSCSRTSCIHGPWQDRLARLVHTILLPVMWLECRQASRQDNCTEGCLSPGVMVARGGKLEKKHLLFNQVCAMPRKSDQDHTEFYSSQIGLSSCAG